MHLINGYLDGATRKASPNHMRGHIARELVILHYTASYTAGSAINSFANKSSKASAHFVVDIDGEITQMVNCIDTAWHAGNSQFEGKGQVNQRSIGIEIVNPGYHFKNAAGAYLDWRKQIVPNSKLLPFQPMIEARDPWVGSAKQYWPSFPEAQLDAVEAIIRACGAAYPNLRAVRGHRDVDSLRRLKVDPGPAFPMSRFENLLPCPDTAPLYKVRSPASPLNVRTGPGTEFALHPSGPLENGRTVQFLKRENQWFEIKINHLQKHSNPVSGWCHSGYLIPA